MSYFHWSGNKSSPEVLERITAFALIITTFSFLTILPKKDIVIKNNVFHSFASFQFSFSACKFKVQKSKEGTGRVVMWKMGIRNSFTMEATFCGSTLGKTKGSRSRCPEL